MLEVELIDKLRDALTAEPEELGGPGTAVQDALNVVLGHYRGFRGSAQPDAQVVACLSWQLTALEIPLTELLVERLQRLDPDVSTGEAHFIAAVDARMIRSVSLQMLMPPLIAPSS